jgi:hypothetical protein
MTETIFYIKKGRKYIPHSTYSSEFCDSFPKGTHLVQSYPGGSMRRFNIDPAYAPMIAAGRVAEDTISKALMRASDLRPKSAPMTQAQQDAWNKLIEVFGEEARCLEWPSAREACEAAVKAMQEEANKLLENPSVRKAYERFLLIAELTKEHNGKTD